VTSKNVLVTGGAGFIGSNFIHTVLGSTDWNVRVFDKFGYAANQLSLDGLDSRRVQIVKADLADRAALARALDGIDLVVNFAAESHNDNSLNNPQPFLDSNVVGTFNLLEESRIRGIRLHHVSTDEVFGDLELDDPYRFTESTPYSPSSPYSSTKAASDLLVRAWVRSFGIHATISNCSNNYGPRQHVENFIPRQITNMLNGGSAKVYGTGANVRDWIHVDDHNDAVLRIIEAGRAGETYLIGADGEKSNLEIVAMLNELFGRNDSDIEFVSDRPGHDLRYAIDSSKLRSELNWRPKHDSIREGLEKTVRWYSDNRDWWQSSKDATERMYKGMGK